MYAGTYTLMCIQLYECTYTLPGNDSHLDVMWLYPGTGEERDQPHDTCDDAGDDVDLVACVAWRSRYMYRVSKKTCTGQVRCRLE